jgi:choline dehydrogenase-like flavoprotein
VTLDPVLKDSSGIPAPKLDYTISANSLKMMNHGIARAKEVLAAAGASNIAVESPILNGGWHLLGTARMGTDPERSVVNEWGRCHDVKNLFIVDGSIWGDVRRSEPDLDHPGAGALHRRQHQAAPRQSVRLSNLFD